LNYSLELSLEGTMATSGARRTVNAARQRSGGTRRALIVAATSALRDVGFARASAREIAGRAGCNQAQVFYHFGSVVELLLAALDDVSASRMAAYRSILEEATTLTGLVESARTIVIEDLDSGYVRVLVEMITGAQSVPGLGDQVAQRLVPWNAFAEEAVQRALDVVPLGSLVPAAEAAHAIVAGLLGLELLANLDGNRTQAIALFDRARMLAGLLEMTGALPGIPAKEQS
jgi:AcrR family transcriptional regulator